MRKSSIELNKIYFWTATIRNWNLLLHDDQFKEVMVESLDYLSRKNLIDVFAFVFMPNHVHLIWRINALNGKELPSGSFLKFTAHQFKKMISKDELVKYSVNAPNKKYEFWQRDPLAIELYEAGFDTAQKVAEADYNELYERIKELNTARNIYKGNIGLHDMKLCVDAAKQLGQDIEF